MTNLNKNEAKKKFKMAVSKKLSFSKSPIFKIFFMKLSWIGFGFKVLIDVKGIDVAQPIWGCLT